jgi:hypothetical protein
MDAWGNVELIIHKEKSKKNLKIPKSSNLIMLYTFVPYNIISKICKMNINSCLQVFFFIKLTSMSSILNVKYRFDLIFTKRLSWCICPFFSDTDGKIILFFLDGLRFGRKLKWESFHDISFIKSKKENTSRDLSWKLQIIAK